MTKYTVRRVCMAICYSAACCHVLRSFLMNAIPGNPWLSEKDTDTEATIEALNAKYGLDQPKICPVGQISEESGTGRFWNLH